MKSKVQNLIENIEDRIVNPVGISSLGGGGVIANQGVGAKLEINGDILNVRESKENSRPSSNINMRPKLNYQSRSVRGDLSCEEDISGSTLVEKEGQTLVIQEGSFETCSGASVSQQHQ